MDTTKLINTAQSNPANHSAADVEELRAFMAATPAEKIRLLMHAIEFMELLRPGSATHPPGSMDPRIPTPSSPSV